MGLNADPVADLLREAAETHHRVYRITDGEDPDWASWHANWLVTLSELPRAGGAHTRAERGHASARRAGRGGPRKVSSYFPFMSRPVSLMVLTAFYRG